MELLYLIYCIGFVTIYDPDSESFCEVNDRTFFNVNNVFDWKRDLDTVSIVM